jgi:hypothetical protein
VAFNELDALTAPSFTATGPPPAAERTRILPMTQNADNIWNKGMFFPLFINHRRCWKCYPFRRKYLSQRRKRFWFTFRRFSAGIFKISLRMFSFSPSVRGLLQWTLSFKQPQKKKSQGSLLLNKHSTLMFCFLVCYESVVLSLFTKSQIVCPSENLSSRNLRRNFPRHFPADPYFT